MSQQRLLINSNSLIKYLLVYKANRQDLAHTPKSYQFKQLSQIAEKGSNQSDLKFENDKDIEKLARKAWDEFLNGDIADYDKLTDDVAGFCKWISKYLAYGLLIFVKL